MKRVSVTALLLSLLLIASCGDSKPEGVMAEDRYIDVFTELLVANQLTDEQLGSVNRNYVHQQIFEKYDTDRETFETSHAYYQRNAEAQENRLDIIEVKLETERDRIQEAFDEYRRQLQEEAESDTLDIDEDAELDLDIEDVENDTTITTQDD